MENDNNEKNKMIHDQFEKILPRLWEKGRKNELKIKGKYMHDLQKTLLDIVRDKISAPAFQQWFIEGFRIVDINPDKSIVFGTSTSLSRDWLETRYKNLIIESILTITNIPYQVSFIINEDKARKPDDSPQIQSSAFDFLFDKANDYGDLYDSYISDDISEKASGNFEEERAKIQENISQIGYNETEINLKECVFCGSNDIPNADLDIELKSRNKRIISVKIRGAKCSKCGEEYYDSDDTEIIRNFKKLLN